MTSHKETCSVSLLGNSYLSFIDAGRGPAILLGHSYLFDAEMWRPQIDALSGEFRVIVPDLWGHGNSGPLPRDVSSMADLARYYHHLLDELAVDEVTVVGLSVGGMWAAEMAAQAPGRVRGLALLDTYVGPEPDVSRDQYFALLDAVEAGGSVSELLLDAIAPLFFASATLSGSSRLPARFRQRLQAMDPQTLRGTIAPLGRLIFGRPDRRDLLRTLNIPSW